MKKTYIIPETLVVALNTKTSILQASEEIPVNSSNNKDDSVRSSEVLTKENKNVWDEEW